jgi:predicted nucleic acid-binding protein
LAFCRPSAPGIFVILVDANLLLCAEDSLSENHAAARESWDERLSGRDPVALCWPVVTAFIRIGTNTPPASTASHVERSDRTRSKLA